MGAPRRYFVFPVRGLADPRCAPLRARMIEMGRRLQEVSPSPAVVRVDPSSPVRLQLLP